MIVRYVYFTDDQWPYDAFNNAAFFFKGSTRYTTTRFALTGTSVPVFEISYDSLRHMTFNFETENNPGTESSTRNFYFQLLR